MLPRADERHDILNILWTKVIHMHLLHRIATLHRENGVKFVFDGFGRSKLTILRVQKFRLFLHLMV